MRLYPPLVLVASWLHARCPLSVVPVHASPKGEVCIGRRPKSLTSGLKLHMHSSPPRACEVCRARGYAREELRGRKCGSSWMPGSLHARDVDPFTKERSKIPRDTLIPCQHSYFGLILALADRLDTHAFSYVQSWHPTGPRREGAQAIRLILVLELRYMTYL